MLDSFCLTYAGIGKLRGAMRQRTMPSSSSDKAWVKRIGGGGEKGRWIASNQSDRRRRRKNPLSIHIRIEPKPCDITLFYLFPPLFAYEGCQQLKRCLSRFILRWITTRRFFSNGTFAFPHTYIGKMHKIIHQKGTLWVGSGLVNVWRVPYSERKRGRSRSWWSAKNPGRNIHQKTKYFTKHFRHKFVYNK